MPDTLLGGLIINEILADPNSTSVNFDTDGSGAADDEDEYVEFFNASTAPIDISGIELWDPAQGNWFTFPAGTILQPGGHAIVVTGFNGGPGPTVGANDLVFDGGLNAPVLNNTGDTVIAYDPGTDEYISAYYNTSTQTDPTTIAGFSGTATQSGLGEDFGADIDGYSIQRSTDGANTFTNDETPTPGVTNICFGSDTLIATPSGDRRIVDLKPGDMVLTSDQGPQAIKWVGQRAFDVDTLCHSPNLCPIRIQAGALGEGVPQTDLIVSRQHRIIVNGPIAERMTGSPDILVAAKDLLNLPGVHLEIPDTGVIYCHILLDQHAILIANVAPAESLYLGTQGKKAMTPKAHREISAIFPDAFDADRDWDMARPVLAGHRCRTLLERHMRNEKPLLTSPLHLPS